MEKPVLSLIIPTYNERENLPVLVKRIHDALSGYCSYEIIVVDDNSPDETWKVAEELSKQYPVKVVKRKGKLGLSSAVIEGFKHASGEFLGVMDADMQHPPEILPNLIEEARNGKDIVIASRYTKGGKIENWGLKRKIVSKGARFLTKVLVPQARGIKDPLSGYFIIRRDVVEDVELNPVGYKILLEILVKGKYEDVSEVPFTFGTRGMGKSKLNLGEYANFLRHLYRLSETVGEIVKLVRYMVISVLALFVNMFFFFVLTNYSSLNYIYSSILSLEAMILFSFALSEIWVLKGEQVKRPVNPALRALKYNAFCFGGILINIGVLCLFTNIFDVYYFVSNFFGSIGAVIWNYAMNIWLTWKTK
ncbi:MAG: glycosyltransferase family 2 protein [Candidatus Odinarchaeota archaeon]|nr:glycosyltransferase family 2 protein [Candidatus Odinarchaeota archaeon]